MHFFKTFQLLLFFCISLNTFCYLSHAQYRVNQLSVNEGLSHSDVSGIVQDKSGFIWMGTNNGLNRFNGYDFKIFKNDLYNDNSLTNNRIKSLLCDSKNRIWIATETSVLSYFDPITNTFQKISFNDEPFSHISQIIQDDENNIWFTTNTNELYKLQEENGKFENSGILLPFKSEIIEIKPFKSHIWVCTAADGLWKINQITGKATRIDNPALRMPVSMTKHGDDLLVATYNGIFSLTDALEVKPIYQSKLGMTTNFVVDFNNNIWVGLFNGGILLLKQNDLGNYELKKTYNTKHLLSTNRVNEILIDSFDMLWIGTSGGGAHYIDLKEKPFRLTNKENSALPDNYITAIYENESTLWTGTRNGLLEYDKKTNTSFLKTTGHISYIYQDTSNQLWVGKRFEGLLLYQDNNLIKTYKKDTEENFPSNEVMGVQEDEFGRLWVITFNEGIAIIDIKTKAVLSNLNTKSYLPTNNINYLYLDPQLTNVAWLATRDIGLLKVIFKDPSKISVIKYGFNPKDSTSISSNYVWPILRSKKGDLWVGTLGGGLNKLIETDEGSQFKRYTEKDGLPDNDIESILEDDAHNLWLGGRGITKFDPKNLTFSTYDVKDGLQSNSFKIGAAFKNSKGILYFGGINGLNYFNPSLIVPNPHKPKLVLDELKVLNKTVNVGDDINGRVLLNKSLDYAETIEFKSDENEFTIELLGLHYSNPDKNKYAYKLKGYTKNWIYINATQRKITFANLPSGTYTFIAKVSNNDGLWSNTRSLKIKILPPWWATWWAYIFYFGIFILVLSLYKNFVNRQSKLKNELIFAEKEMNLNDEKMKFFTSISHEIRTPLTLINSPLDDIIEAETDNNRYLEKLSLIRKNVNRLLNLTNQLLDFRKMETGNMKLNAAEGNFTNFSKEIYRFFQSLAEEKEIDYTYQSIPENIKLTFDRQNFEIILTNLISNAFKYTNKKGKISILLKAVGNDQEPAVFEKINKEPKLIDNYLEILIEDNGIGMSEKNIEFIFDRYYQVKDLNTLSIHGTGIGLSLVKELVILHGGEIKVKSTENVGSKFFIRIPFGQNHLDNSFINKDFKNSDHKSYYHSQHIKIEPVEPETIENESDSIKKRILLVEDNKEVQDYLNNHLKNQYNVIVASNGKEGYDKAKTSIPDIIISDVMMPQMDGLEMLKALKNDPDLSFIPVILLTARTATLYELEGVEIGAHDYITKPFNISILKGKIANILLARENFKQYYNQNIKNEPTKIKLPNSEQKFLDDISKLVLDNLLNDDFSVKTLVKEMGMSQSSCYKRIKELTGRSAVQFIRDIRLKRAGELLMENKHNVSEVAFMVGINDLKYFREKFKEHYDCNPSEFNNNIDD
ncbi:two-component regulator propeller domain-containing protein [Tamlana sp. I1]|uniref:hybrid sensor histidine kinase/response regulator transcription factor n=1 Tax=Tamlana sp. I1 TaxID=2762061 RepID=UPI00188E1C24|nr:two-component regulator propeller domain-containing protein [Tamlana sp. I1]